MAIREVCVGASVAGLVVGWVGEWVGGSVGVFCWSVRPGLQWCGVSLLDGFASSVLAGVVLADRLGHEARPSKKQKQSQTV